MLLVIGDGARKNVAGEAEKVAKCREILRAIDWPCDVLTNFSDSNLGCRNRVASGLDWAFSNVDEAIILEDDCLPSEDFFIFTSELLDRYRDDESVGSISGTYSNGVDLPSDSYHFSQFPEIWGWASWARVWKKYDVNIEQWPTLKREGLLNKVFATKKAVCFWTQALNDTHARRIDTWDYQFSLLHWTQGWLSIKPNRNLVSNIGFGQDATHTLDSTSSLANFRTEELTYPLSHPTFISLDRRLDFLTEESRFSSSAWFVSLNKLLNRLPKPAQRLIRVAYGLTRK